MKRTSFLFIALVIALSASVGVNAKTKRSHNSKRVVSTQSVKRAYVNKIKRLSGYGDNYGYFLTDITGDNIPELWVKYGTCEADYVLEVYTYTSSGLKRLLSTSAGHTGYYGYRNGKYVIAHWGHMGYEAITRITYSGKKLREKIIYESPGEVDDYKELAEPEFDFIPFTSTSEIEYYF